MEIEFPAEPGVAEPVPIPMLAAGIPLAVSVAMALAFHSIQYLAVSLLSPVLLVGGVLGQRRRLGREQRRQLARFHLDLAHAEAMLSAAVADEVRRRRLADPDPARVRQIASVPQPRLWERRPSDPDALRVRLGTADLPARARHRRAGAARDAAPETANSVPVTVGLRELGVLGLTGPRPPVAALARWLVAQLATLHGPGDLSLVLLTSATSAEDWRWMRWLPHLRDAACGAIGVGSTVADRAEIVSGLLDQLVGRSAPRHSAALALPPGPFLVTVVDEISELNDLPGLHRLLREGPSAGLFALCTAPSRNLLPAACHAVAEITGEVGSRLRLSLSREPPIEDVLLDGVSADWAEQLARRLAPLREANRDEPGHPPQACSLLNILDLDQPTVENVLARWATAARSTRAVLGLSANGPMVVDLAADGPHALVAGTTGAGKSELLQTLVASLASTSGPDALTFVLIDYKGGAAFADCRYFPHTVGMVTDLDNHLTERALRSLNAELARRERVLGTVGVSDIDDYWKLLDARASHPRTDSPASRLTEARRLPGETRQAGAGAVGLGGAGVRQPQRGPAVSEPLPRLVIVVDEFAFLAEELPEFVRGLTAVAQRGRSLGLHLVLATQRPGGAVSAEIRANAALRIALRVTDEAESVDLVDAPDAAHFSAALPGRALVRTPGGTPVEFQTAHCGDRSRRGDPVAPGVTIASWPPARAPGLPLVEAPDDDPTDLQRLVAAAAGAAKSLQLAAPRRPWLPPLPPIVTGEMIRSVRAAGGHAEREDVVPLGLMDHPDHQLQDIFGFDLAGGGSLLIAGGPRSGRSTALRTFAASVAASRAAEDLHLYAIDCAGGALQCIEELPQCGAVVSRSDVVRGTRVLTRLLDEVSRRQTLLARGGWGSVAEQRAAVPAVERLAWLVVLVDSWEGFLGDYEDLDGGRSVETLLRLARDGESAGVRLIATSDRQGLFARLGTVMRDKLILRLTDRADYALAGLPARAVPETMPPGRGILAGAGVEVQLATLGGDPDGIVQARELSRVAERARGRSTTAATDRLPFRVEPLPSMVRLPELSRSVPSSSLWTACGVGGDLAEPVGIELGGGVRSFLVAGPAGSGRTTTLLTLGRGLLAAGRSVVVVTPRQSALGSLAGSPGVLALPAAPAAAGESTVVGARDLFGRPEAASGMAEERMSSPGPPGWPLSAPTRSWTHPDANVLADLLANGPAVVLVDDVEALADPDLSDLLARLVRASDARHPVVVAGRSDDLLSTFRGPALEMRRSRSGVLLCPGPTDGELLGVRTGRAAAEKLPGRGILVLDGRCVPIQVAHSDPATEPRPPSLNPCAGSDGRSPARRSP